MAQVVDVGHVDAAGVAAPGLQARAQIGVPAGQAPLHPLQQVGAIGIVVASHIVFVQPVQGGLPGAFKQQVQRLAGGGEMRVLAPVDVAAPGVVEVREVELLRALFAHQRQQCGQVVRVHGRHGEAQAHLHAPRAQEAHGGQAAVKRAVQPAEFVVRGLEAVQADAHVVKTGSGHAVGHGLVNQRAVGGQADVKAHALRARGNVEQVGAHQGLAAREDEHRHAESAQVVHHRMNLLRTQLARVVVVGRQGVAMLAGEVAAADQVPDHDRAGGLAVAHHGVLACGLGFCQLAHVLADAKHGQSSFRRRPVFLSTALEYRMSCWRQCGPSSWASWAACSATSSRLRPCSMANRL